MSVINPPDSAVVYPSSDGLPMADNTLQAQWIDFIRENLIVLFADNPDVFVASDNLIYPVEGDPTIRIAPDVYVAFGRPKGHRGSYQVWLEGDIFPQVIFEVLSPGNRPAEMEEKRDFYSDYGAKEYYVYDPDHNRLEAWIRRGRRLNLVPVKDRFTSPLLNITFELAEPELVIYQPAGERFLSTQERETARQEALQKQEAERKRAERERKRADKAEAAREAERQRAEALAKEAELLKAKLRAMGIDPDKL